MRLLLRDVEPFSLPHVDREAAAAFLRNVTGREAFDFLGSRLPLSLAIYDLKYAPLRNSYAHGWLLDVDVDSLQGEDLERHVIGSLTIELERDASQPRLITSAFTVPH